MNRDDDVGREPVERKRAPIDSIVEPLEHLMELDTALGLFMIAITGLAMAVANSELAGAYDALWHTKLSIEVGSFHLGMDLHHWLNDGLMALFFFVVGLEIKREFLVGELSEPMEALLPLGAAIGGAIAPAAIFTLLNHGTPVMNGWGIPVATDIVFAIGILSLVGSSVPRSIKTLLLAVAIADDIIAVLIIALFYSSGIAWMMLGFAGLVLLVLVGVNQLGVRHPLPYAILALVLWYLFLRSGIHATVGGVLVAFTIPARTRVNTDEFLVRVFSSLDHFQSAGEPQKGVMTNDQQQKAVWDIEDACQDVATPLQRLEETLHPWTYFGVIPLFVFANAGVAIPGDPMAALTTTLALGIVLGLVLGKQVGIMGAMALLVRFTPTKRPQGISWTQLWGLSWLGGIGFTMSLFIGNLAFSDEALLTQSKLAILAASLISSVGGYLVLRSSTPTSSEIATAPEDA